MAADGVAADARADRAGHREARRTTPRKRPNARSAGACRSCRDDGKLAVAGARSADNKDRWYRHARPRDREDARGRHAARRRLDPGSRGGRSRACEFLRDTPACGSSRSVTAGCTSTRWTSRPTAQGEAADVGQVGDHRGRPRRPTAGRSTSRRPKNHPGRASPLLARDRRRRAHASSRR